MRLDYLTVVTVSLYQRRLKPCYEENENSKIKTGSDMPELEDVPGATDLI